LKIFILQRFILLVLNGIYRDILAPQFRASVQKWTRRDGT